MVAPISLETRGGRIPFQYVTHTLHIACNISNDFQKEQATGLKLLQ